LLATRLVREAGAGVVSLLSDASFVDAPGMGGFRRFLGRSFKRLRVDCFHGDAGDASGRALAAITMTDVVIGPDIHRTSSPSARRREQKLETEFAAEVSFRELPLAGLNVAAIAPHPVVPAALDKYSFRPACAASEYRAWMPVGAIGVFPPVNGLLERRGGALTDISYERLKQRMIRYHGPSGRKRADDETDEEHQELKGLRESQTRFNPVATHDAVMGKFNRACLRNYIYKPLDRRWCYYSDARTLWADPKPRLEETQRDGESFIVVRRTVATGREGTPFYFARDLGDNDLMRGHAYFFPCGAVPGREGNLSGVMQDYLRRLDFGNTVSPRELSLMVWNHVLAVGYASAYLAENAAGLLRQEWPRVPFPRNRNTDAEREVARARLLASAALGERVAALLDVGRDVEGVTCNTPRRELADVAVLHRRDENGDIVLSVPWGRRDQSGRVVLNPGRANRRTYTADEWRALAAGARAPDPDVDGERLPGLHAGAVGAALGEKTLDVYLNDEAYWSNIPARIWDFVIGGYPVLRKWLSYRCRDTLGRGLTADELQELPRMARRLAALRLLEPALNLSYARIRDRAEAFM